MEPSLIICLYSKYSSHCKKILDRNRSLPFIKNICVDNENVRKRIKNDKKL